MISYWFCNVFCRSSHSCSWPSPSLSWHDIQFPIGFIRFPSSPCSPVMSSHHTIRRSQHTQVGELVFHWFYNDSAAETHVPQGREPAAGHSQRMQHYEKSMPKAFDDVRTLPQVAAGILLSKSRGNSGQSKFLQVAKCTEVTNNRT